MKTFILLLSLSVSCYAQNLVQFYGSNTNANTVGIPYYWPMHVQLGTNAEAGWVLLTDTQLRQIIATNQPAYNAWESNKTYQVQAAKDANLARLNELYAKIPVARSNFTFIQNAGLTNAATLSAAVKMEAQMLDGITEFIQRLGPVLKQLYKPEDDSTQ